MVFYMLNVEQDPFRGDDWQRFYSNVGLLPIDERSTFIRILLQQHRLPRLSVSDGSLSAAWSRAALADTAQLRAGSPLAAYQAGRVQSYRDVIELSHQP